MKKLTILTVFFSGLAASPAAGQTRLNGAGATFPEPLYQRMNAEYLKVAADVRVDYHGIGSSGGISSIIEKTIDFAGTDAPLAKGEIAKLGGPDNVIENPACAGAVVPAYNLADANDLKFTGDLLAQIYLGKVNKWNDPAIAKINPGVALPDLAITPVYRTDGSGTNFVWTHYLAELNGEFKNSVGMGKQVKWPVGQGGKGTAGVAAVVQQTPGAIGYVEQNYADKNSIAFGSVQNKAGKFVRASADTVSAAARGAAAQLKGNQLTANVWNQDGDNAYPIASFTYLVVYKDLGNLKSRDQAQAMASYLWWAVHDGQKFAADLDYVPLTPQVVDKVSAVLNTLTFNGQSVKPTGAK